MNNDEASSASPSGIYRGKAMVESTRRYNNAKPRRLLFSQVVVVFVVLFIILFINRSSSFLFFSSSFRKTVYLRSVPYREHRQDNAPVMLFESSE